MAEASTRWADIDGFWHWFVSVEAQLAERLVNDTILRELDARVRQFGKLTWEVGPGREKARWLVISGDGNPERDAIAKAIVARAPELPGWELYTSRPPKKWMPRFELHRDDECFAIDAGDRRYVLLKYPDGTFDIDVWAPGLVGLDEDLRGRAVSVALDNILGEERRNLLIVDVQVLCDAASQPDETVRFERLSDHLISLTKN